MKKTPEATFNDVVESFKTFYKIPAGTPKPCEKLINEIWLPFAKKQRMLSIVDTQFESLATAIEFQLRCLHSLTLCWECLMISCEVFIGCISKSLFLI